jgi:hypothetical protein
MIGTSIVVLWLLAGMIGGIRLHRHKPILLDAWPLCAALGPITIIAAYYDPKPENADEHG